MAPRLTRLALALAFAALVGAGCASDETAAPRADEGPTESGAAAPAEAAAAPAEAGCPSAGHVTFDVVDADFQKDILPLIASQTGVRVNYYGEAFAVTQALTDVHWKTALKVLLLGRDLRLVERDGSPWILAANDAGVGESAPVSYGEGVPATYNTGAPPSSGGAPSGRPPHASSGRPAGSGGTSTYDNTYGTGGAPAAYGGGDRAKSLLQNVGTTSTGAR
jgi:hypothetical protein